jgi:flagellar biosynthetic protein FliQ
MHLDHATELLRHTLVLTLIVAAPLLGVALIVGVISSLLQAATQIQEQTLSFIPKLVGLIIAAAVLMPWIGTKLMEFAREIFTQ